MSAAPAAQPAPHKRNAGPRTGSRPQGVGAHSCYPRESWLVLDQWDGGRLHGIGILTDTQQDMWRVLDARKERRTDKIFVATISEREWMRVTGLSRRTIQRNARAMVKKHAVDIWRAATPGHQRTVYRMIEWRECLQRCADDPAIGVRWVEGREGKTPHFFVWSHGRRLMSEDELGPDGWRIDAALAGGAKPPQQLEAPSDVPQRPGESQSNVADSAVPQNAPPLTPLVLKMFRQACSFIHEDAAREMVTEAHRLTPLTEADVRELLSVALRARGEEMRPYTSAMHMRKVFLEKAEGLRQARAAEAAETAAAAEAAKKEAFRLSVEAYIVLRDHASSSEQRSDAADTLRWIEKHYPGMRPEAERAAIEKLYGNGSGK